MTAMWTGAIALLAAAVPGLVWAQDDTAGITGITKSAARLTVPPDSSQDLVLRYGLGFPFQVAPDKVAVSVNLRVEHAHTYDYEYGSDIVVFDALETIDGATAVPVSRNETFTDPATGEGRLAIKYPVIGGFVPLGARRPDGSPHPHAGTGFGICQSLTFPTDAEGLFSWKSKFVHETELHQLAYDGERFTGVETPLPAGITHPRVADSGWVITAPGIVHAIPDGDDLIWACAASGPGGSVSAVVRFSRDSGQWLPVAVYPVTPAAKGWAEPSLVRDVDGSWLFGARGTTEGTEFGIRVWRSADQGATWSVVVDAPETIQEAPVSINSAADGTPFVSACLRNHGREILCLWPLNASRDGLMTPLIVRPARADFGPPPAGAGGWMVDHPSAVVARLADGQWHSLLAYRILQSAEFSKADPAPQSGCYVEEVFSSGPVRPTWKFE